MPALDRHGKESLNFQITVTIASILSSVLLLVGIGVILLIAIAIANVVFIIIASVKTSEGRAFTYPMTLRFLK